MPCRTSKIISLEQAVECITSGSTVAVGGLSYFGAPMSLVRELVRRQVRDLTIITAAVTSIQADLLIAGGCVRKIISSYIALEELGLAPNFRRAAEKGTLEIVEVGEAFLAFGLKAAASGSPYYALPLPIAASDGARVNHLYKVARDPFSDKEVVCVPALRADVALLHAQVADCHGNLAYSSASFMDGLLARASDYVIASADEIADAGSRLQAAIPGFMVRGVVPLRGAARPTGSFGQYDVDRKELSRFASASRKPDSFAAYCETFADEQNYLAALGERPIASDRPDTPVSLDERVSKAETIAYVISRCVRDGMFTGAGTGCWEVAAGLRLAQMTHAPNLNFTMGGSGSLNAKVEYLPASLNGDDSWNVCEATVPLEDIFDHELRGRFDIMFASAMQVDKYGNLNLVGIGPHDKPKLRGPGTVGLEFAPFARELVIFLRNHSPQTLVEKVDFISGIGYGSGPGSRACWGIEDSVGPKLVVTNLAVMDFEEKSKRMRLQSVHPSVTVQNIVENTGFELIIPDEVPTTALPSPEELELLRTRIDRGGMLAGLIP